MEEACGAARAIDTKQMNATIVSVLWWALFIGYFFFSFFIFFILFIFFFLYECVHFSFPLDDVITTKKQNKKPNTLTDYISTYVETEVRECTEWVIESLYWLFFIVASSYLIYVFFSLFFNRQSRRKPIDFTHFDRITCGLERWLFDLIQ